MNMTQVQTTLEHVEQRCLTQGVRFTNKRKEVLSSLLQAGIALSAYELIDCYQENFGQSIPAMSIYRILDFLRSQGLVHKLHLANKYVACTHIACNHEHEVSQFLICTQCQKVTEISISNKMMRELKDKITHAGFSLVNPELEMHCICNGCRPA